MRILIDTNLLLRYLNEGDPRHRAAFLAIRRLVEQGHIPCVGPQNLVEAWVVMTRPAEVNGFGHSPQQAEAAVRSLLGTFVLLPETPALFPQWLELCSQHAVRGRQAHDARLVALMRVHQLTHILTWNHVDFARYNEMTCLTPTSADLAVP